MPIGCEASPRHSRECLRAERLSNVRRHLSTIRPANQWTYPYCLRRVFLSFEAEATTLFTTNLSETFQISLFQRTPQANKQCPSYTDFSSHRTLQQHSLTLREFQSATKDPFKAPHNKEVAAHQQSQYSAVPKPKQYESKGRFATKFPQPTAIANGCQE